MNFCHGCKSTHSGAFKVCDQCRSKRRESRLANLDRARKVGAAQARRWRAKNPEASRVASRRYYEKTTRAQREKDRRAASRRRALLRGATVGDFSPSALEARLSMYPRCWICKTAEPTHVDHVKPLSKGGAHILANFRPACADCNLRKGQQWPFPT